VANGTAAKTAQTGENRCCGRLSGTAMPAGSREVKPYLGPFPPSGMHEYEFTLYALRTERLDLPKKVSFDAFTEAVQPTS
jgi:phosphatidylethanolamine-binding protein (PEBP) family uncharacterized protein